MDADSRLGRGLGHRNLPAAVVVSYVLSPPPRPDQLGRRRRRA